MGYKGPNKEVCLGHLKGPPQKPVCRKGRSEMRGRSSPEARVVMGPDHIASSLTATVRLLHRDPLERSKEKWDTISLTM